MTNCCIKKGVTNCRILKMEEHTNNLKKRGNAENKTAFYYIRYRQANASRISALTFCLEIVIASKSPVRSLFSISFFFYDRKQQQTDKTDGLTPLAHTPRGVTTTTTTTDADKTDCLTPLAHTRRGVKIPFSWICMPSLLTDVGGKEKQVPRMAA